MRSIGYNLSAWFAPEGRRFIKRRVARQQRRRGRVDVGGSELVGVEDGMPESKSSSSGLFSTEQLHVTMFIGAASAQIIRCCHVAVQGSAQGTTDEERRRSIDGVVAQAGGEAREGETTQS